MTKNTAPTARPTVNLTIVEARGDYEVHLTGCAHLGRHHDAGRWTFDAADVDDVTFEMWGASGIASDDYSGSMHDEGYRAHTLAEFDPPYMAPCVGKALKAAGRS